MAWKDRVTPKQTSQKRPPTDHYDVQNNYFRENIGIEIK